MQTSREVILNTIDFSGPDRLGIDFPEPYGSDFYGAGLTPSPDGRPDGGRGADEWGAVWENIGASGIGEVKQSPLASWDDFPALKIPDIRDPRRFEGLREARAKAGDKFLYGVGLSLYARILYLRGLANAWCDIHAEPERLCELIDILTGMNLHVVEECAKAGCDAVMWYDDWGLQDRLMISPEKWREL